MILYEKQTDDPSERHLIVQSRDAIADPELPTFGDIHPLKKDLVAFCKISKPVDRTNGLSLVIVKYRPVKELIDTYHRMRACFQ